MLKLGNIATFTGCTFCWCVQPACPELVTAFHTLHFVMSSFHMQCACFLSQNNDSILWFHHFLSTLLATYPKVMTKWVYDISPFYDIIISYSAHMLLSQSDDCILNSPLYDVIISYTAYLLLVPKWCLHYIHSFCDDWSTVHFIMPSFPM